MKKAIVLTAFNRPDYLAEVLDSWLAVRGLEDWDFYISIDEYDPQSEVSSLATYFQRRALTEVYIIGQSPKLGVLKHPYVVMDALFADKYDFVVRTEDDLVVSDGILDYFDYAIGAFQDAHDVKTVHAYTSRETGSEHGLYATQNFNPWIFGTWAKDWPDLRDNWDLDYSTYNGVPGHQAGFDWNYNTRVYPSNEWYGIYPEVSRVKNIGEWGVHGTPADLPASPTFVESNATHGGHFEFQL